MRWDRRGPLPPFGKGRYTAGRLIGCHRHQTWAIRIAFAADTPAPLPSARCPRIPERFSGPSLTFVPVSDEKRGKNRLHIDVNPTGCSQDEEVDRLIGLGARPVDVGQGEGTSWVVLADPEGNEFCVLRDRID